MTTDTPEQARILRMKGARAARAVRRMYPKDTRVIATGGHVEITDAMMHGTVVRHVPGLNAQGGYLVVEWDNGQIGRASACTIVREDGRR